MKRFSILLSLSLFASLIPNIVCAQFNSTAADAPAIAKRGPDQKIESMLLGVYHFNNPGLDEFNTEVDDYFTDQRQAEIADVVARLAKFKPTKIFVEVSPKYQELMDERFQAFVKGDLDLKSLKNGRSETYQLGFQIAKSCNLSGVHCIDAPGAWLGSDVNATATKQMPLFYKSVTEKIGAFVQEENKRMIANTVRQNLIEHNTAESIMKNHSYYNQLSTLVVDPSKPSTLIYDSKKEDEIEYTMIGVEQQNIGAELVGKWYTRNIKIFSNILRSIEKDDERILFIFGQGHIRPIQHFCDDHPLFDLVSPNRFLEDK